ncbi:MAG TPA: hypothetical protein PKN32_03010 [Bacteroidales bacterium]|nr:hypothetical protein [Bacteroidales bacterium]
MRKFLCIIVILALSLNVFSQLSKKEIKAFCDEFAGYISEGNLENAMHYIDQETREQQIENILLGNTSQFFSELLSGNTKNGKFFSPDIKHIKKMKTVKILSIDNGFSEVSFKITLTDGFSITTTLTLNVNSKEEMVIIPAVG